MTSFIIVSNDQTRRREYIRTYSHSLKVDPIDITIIEKETAIKQNLNSIGIDEILNMQKKLFLKPIKSPVKAIIIEEAQLLTIQAQNSMLKILEEPPENTIIFLSADSSELFLSTIISRCKLTVLDETQRKLSEEETGELTDFIDKLNEMPISMRFKKAEILAKDKDKAIKWTANLIILLREKFLKQYASEANNSQNIHDSIKIIKSFQRLHTILKTTNTNTRFAIEDTFLKIG